MKTALKTLVAIALSAPMLMPISAVAQANENIDPNYARLLEDILARISKQEGVLTYRELIKITPDQGIAADLAPRVRFTSPLNGAMIAGGEGLMKNGSNNGSGFVINLEVMSRDAVPLVVNEATQTPSDPGIRNVGELGKINPEFPGLFVFADKPMITPDGKVIPKNTNLAALFNVAGTDDTPGRGVTVWAGWHVLESFPASVKKVMLTAAVVDNNGRIGADTIHISIKDGLTSGNALTPAPSTFPGAGEIDEAGPLVEIIAPRVPSAIAVGDQVNLATDQTGSLNFIQVNILDLANAGIAVDELGDTVTAPELGPGSILDPTQLGKGDNRNFPGLHFSFDVPLQAPTGVVVPPGGNLAPVFNVVGSEIDPLTGATRVVADWVVGGSLIVPEGKEFVTFTAVVTDNTGKAGTAKRTFGISPVLGGQKLTKNP